MSRISAVLAAAIVLAASLSCGNSRGEDMSVYTKLSRVEGNKSEIVARSLTVFHAGKVYDYMEGIGEVVVFEPVHHQLIVMNENRLAARVEFGELQQFLKVGRHEMEKALVDLAQADDRRSQQLLRAIEFQLNPEFEETYQPTLERLTLSSGVISYDVDTARIESPELVTRYLAYADWAKQLNFVLHQQAMYPGPRLALNESLRKKGLLPTKVELQVNVGSVERLRAEHRYEWELQPSTRHLLTKWERMLESDETRWVSFHQYQEQLVNAVARKAE